MSDTDRLLANNAAFASARRQLPEGEGEGEGEGDGERRSGGGARLPSPKVAVLACMDARLDPAQALGLREGDAHVIRNAGGAATDDAIRSLIVSQRLLGTEEIVLIHHTDCGMLTFSDDEVKRAIEVETGVRPPFALEAFTDLDDDVRQTMARLKASPFLPHKEHIRGFVYDLDTGRLREVPYDEGRA